MNSLRGSSKSARSKSWSRCLRKLAAALRAWITLDEQVALHLCHAFGLCHALPWGPLQRALEAAAAAAWLSKAFTQARLDCAAEILTLSGPWHGNVRLPEQAYAAAVGEWREEKAELKRSGRFTSEMLPRS
jgi:hypothetical protein